MRLHGVAIDGVCASMEPQAIPAELRLYPTLNIPRQRASMEPQAIPAELRILRRTHLTVRYLASMEPQAIPAELPALPGTTDDD